MDRLLSIGQAAKAYGVSVSTLRRWERTGKITAERTVGNQRRYKIDEFNSPNVIKKQSVKITIAYARVSSHDQKNDLERQKHVLEAYCASYGWSLEIISDIGSGMNYHKSGLKKLLNMILSGNINRLVLTHKDRLLRFGAELIFSLCERQKVEVVIINQGEMPSFEEELTKDVLEIITVFSARLYGARSRKNKKLLENLQDAIHVTGS